MPTPVNPVLDDIFYKGGYAFTPTDPVVSFIQWAAEEADPAVYGHLIAGRHILMLQGIVDHYILPDIANATSLPMGLDIGGTPLDDPTVQPDLAGQTPFLDVAPYVGASNITLPTSHNVVVQWPADGIEDGHEIVFQTDPPKHEYQCFLASYAAGAPMIVPGASTDTPCP
jgi:hypothetical protein